LFNAIGAPSFKTIPSDQFAFDVAEVAMAMVIMGAQAQTPSAAFAAPSITPIAAKNIVLVHGALLNGSTWRPVYDILAQHGFCVSTVQEPQTGLGADVAATWRVLDVQDGPTVLVGHSYGGMLIIEMGANPKVKALVYVAALAPDVGESAGSLTAKFPIAASADLSVTADGFAYYTSDKMFKHVAADVDRDTVNFMAAAQKFVAGAAFETKVSAAAWRSEPSYAVVAQDDKTISPELQRAMYRRAKAKTLEIKTSHAAYISQPQEVARII
jgi:pimeloyl-ACP methyl ester carboxylesterase